VEHGRAQFRRRYEGVFRRCRSCGFMFVEQPSWLQEAYAEPINRSDTGYVARNLRCRDRVRMLIELLLRPDGTFLDYGAGYGLFVRLMRDLGYDFRSYDLYCQSWFCRGFEAPTPLTGPFEAVTAFEVFEHVVDPCQVVRTISAVTSCLILGTALLPDPAPTPEAWWYYGLEHGQHVSFYTLRSLESLAGQFGYRCLTDGAGLHILTREAISPNIFSRLASPWRRRWVHRFRRRAPLTQQDHDRVSKEMLSGS